MGAAPMNNDTAGNGRASVEHYGHICYDQNEVKNINLPGSQNLGSSGEDESRINYVDADIKHGPGMEVLARDDLKLHPQQTQGSLVNWERFLPVKSVKVLLVESDDSTRHVVSALLRNCSYEVTAVAHGLQAWKTLQDVSSRIDLVLTEVVMPLLSGMDLLCKIMEHKTLKNIPVIMMSSHDSMGIVFKCLSKGAVDFLAKPIRKNELKNLWQHVWRRCYSSSGSGSGSESGTQAEQQPAKFRISNDSESNTSNTDEHGNGSNGSSIQNCSEDGSGTETSWTKRTAETKHVSPWDQVPDAPDSTCARVEYVRPMKVHRTNEAPDTVALAKGTISENRGMKMEDALSEIDCKPHDKGQPNQEHGTCGVTIPQPQSRDCNGVSSGSSFKGKTDHGKVQYLELTLKRLQHGVADDGNAAKDDHNILRHSDISAFSRYNTISSCSKFDAPGKHELAPVFKLSESSAFQPVQNGYHKELTDVAASNKIEAPSKGAHQNIQVQHHHHHHHHHHYHHRRGRNLPEPQQHPDFNELSLDNMLPAAARSSNLVNGIGENISGGGSASGSNQGSDGNNNGSNNTPSGGAMYNDTENGNARNSGSDGGFSGKANSGAVDEDRVALREAALTKFRQKRKERCFEKKVRYQSRKKLAEQRPRIRGQFVKQIKSEGKSGDDSQSNGLKDSCFDTDR